MKWKEEREKIEKRIRRNADLVTITQIYSNLANNHNVDLSLDMFPFPFRFEPKKSMKKINETIVKKGNEWKWERKKARWNFWQDLCVCCYKHCMIFFYFHSFCVQFRFFKNLISRLFSSCFRSSSDFAVL